MGCPVYILHSKTDYVQSFNHIIKKSKKPTNNGKKRGFPIGGKCGINRECKISPIHNFYKQFGNEEVYQYIGIAADEPKRLERLHKDSHKISLLEKYKYTEE